MTDEWVEFRAFADSIRDEAEDLRVRADALCAVATVADAAARLEGVNCPPGGCKDCPAGIGSPGLCVFSRVRDSVTRAILKRRGDPVVCEDPAKQSELSEIIEVP